MTAVFKTKDEAYSSLKSNFEKLVGQTTQTGSVIDMYNKVIGIECAYMYNLIEENKKAHNSETTPHCRIKCSACGANKLNGGKCDARK